MKVTKRLGIWMDHSNAHLMEFTSDPVETKLVESRFTPSTRVNRLGKGEYVMNNLEQHQHAEYYKQLGNTIWNYDHVILFGPTSAKVELFNHLKTNRRFLDKRIHVHQTDKLTENQQHAFVKEYFSKQKD